MAYTTASGFTVYNIFDLNKRYNDFSTEEIVRYCSDVAVFAPCFKNHISSEKDTSSRTPVSGIRDKTVQIRQALLKKNAIGASFPIASYYINSKKHSKANIGAVNAFAVSIDTTHTDTDADGILAMFRDGRFGDLPWPSYAEKSGELKFIWVFKEPVYFPRDLKKKKRMFTYYRRTCGMIAKVFKDAGIPCRAVDIRGTLRIPFSFDGTFRKRVVTENLNGKRHTMKEFGELLLPPMPDGYKGKTDPKTKALSREETVKHNLAVLNDMKRVQKAYNGYGLSRGFRYNMCRVFYKYACLSGSERDEAMRETLKFNLGFLSPLSEGEIYDKLHDTDICPLKNKTIRELVGIPKEDAKEMMLEISSYRRKASVRKPYYRKARMRAIEKKETRYQKYFLRLKKAFEYFSKNGRMTNREAAKALGVSVRTVIKYRKIFKGTAGRIGYTAAMFDKHLKSLFRPVKASLIILSSVPEILVKRFWQQSGKENDLILLCRI